MTPEQRDNLLGAHAALTARVLDLEAENARLKAELTTLQKTFREISDDHDRVHIENAALRKELGMTPADLDEPD